METKTSFLDIDQKKYDFNDEIEYLEVLPKGLSIDVVKKISQIKKEPEWMLNIRIKAYEEFLKKPMQNWGPDLSHIDFNNITYYMSSTNKVAKEWEDVPENIKKTFERLGIPEAEKKFLAGAGAMYESTTAYHKLREDLEKKGVIFCDTDTAIHDHPELIKKYFGTVVPMADNKFAALNTAVWSGGSFIYVPKGVKIDLPLQAYFRINAQNVGQFERTLIIVDEGAEVHYVEGCLPAWEEVSCGNTMVAIPEIKEGDTVLNSNGENTMVEKTIKRPFDGELINIQPISVGNTFSLTPEHPVLAISRDKVLQSKRKNRRLSDYNNNKLSNVEPEFIEAGELRNGDFLIYPINQVKIDNFDLDETKMKFLGYYLSEGHTSIINGCDAVVLSFNENERDYINEAKQLSKEIIGKIPSEFNDKEKHELRLTVYSKELKNLCDKHCGNYAEMKKLSKEIMDLPPSKQRHLLETYINGDGNVFYKIRKDGKSKQKAVRSSTTSRQLSFQIQELLARQGIYSTINIREKFDEKMKDGKIIHHNRFYINYFGQNNLIKNVKRKENYFIVPIRNIGRHPYKGSVYNFHVQNEPNTYLVKGFAVHNCSAPSYSTESLHTAVVEVVALKDSRVRYTTLQNWSDNIYNLVTKRAHAYENAYVEWLDANIGCLAEGTKISTNPGINDIEKINEGDKVITFNETTKELEAKKVLAKKFSGIKPTYNIILDKGKRELISTSNHPFLSLKYYSNRAKKLGRYEFAWTPLSQLSAESYLLVAKQMPDLGKPYTLTQPNMERSMLNRNQYGAEYRMSTNYKYTKLKLPKETNEDLLWLFGCTIGDGNTDIAKSKKSDSNRYGRLAFSVPDNDHAREKIVKLMKSIFGLEKYTERKDKVLITYNSLFLAEFFKLNGIDGNAHTKRVPKWVYSLPLNQKRALLAGYIEADGRINGNNSRFKACNKELLEDLKILAMTCGIEVNRIKEEKEIKRIKINGINAPEKEYTSYIMYVSDLFKLRELLSEGNKIKVPKNPRTKKGRFLDKTKRRIHLPEHLELLQITSIKPNGDLPTYDLEIEGTHNFIANGVIVHNSAITMKYPSVYLKGEHAKANILSVAFANNGQNQDAGAKAIHFVPNTSSTIISKSISKGTGKTTFRGLVQVMKGAHNCKSHMRCVKPDTILLGDNKAISDYNINDSVVGSQGLNKVNQTFINDFEGGMIKIKGTGLLPIEVTKEHPLFVSKSKNIYYKKDDGKYSYKIELEEPHWENPEKLIPKKSHNEGYYLVMPRLIGNIEISSLNLKPFMKNENNANIISKEFPLNNDTAWLMGLYVAEGSADDQGHVKFSLNKNETKLRDKIIAIAKYLGYSSQFYEKEKDGSMDVNLFSVIISRAFRKWFGSGALNKKVADFILLNKNQDIIKSFLIGYTLGDGCISKNCSGQENITHLVTISKILALQLQLLGSRLGVFYRITKAYDSKEGYILGRKVNFNTKYEIRCNSSKRIHAKITNKYLFIPIRYIKENYYKGKVHNIETQDHTYLVNNVITHNCDAIMLNKESKSDTIPSLKINEDDVQVGHEATVGKVGEDQLFYLMSRGLTEQEAVTLIVNGFFKQFTKELPLEYAIEFNKLIELEMKGPTG